MEWITWLLFESPPALAAVTGTILFFLLVYWRRRNRALPLLIGLAVTLLLFVTQSLVTTQREHALAIMGGIERDLIGGRATALAAALANDFGGGAGLDRDEYLKLVRKYFESIRLNVINNTQMRVLTSEPDRFVVQAGYLADIVHRDYAGTFPSRWEITFVQTSAGWRIRDIRSTYLGGLGDPDWTHIAP